MNALDDLIDRCKKLDIRGWSKAAAELAAIRAERDKLLKFINYLRYLEEAEDANAVMWHRGILLRILKVFHIVKITRLRPVDSERPVLVIVEGTNER